MRVLSKDDNAHEHPTTPTTSLLLDRALLGHVDAVQELTDILVPYTAQTLDRCSCKIQS